MLALLFCLSLAADARPLLVTIDDLPLTGPAKRYAPAERAKLHDGMLAALKKHGVKAIAFVTWRNVQADEQALLLRWQREGHELANHSTNHLDYNRTDTAAYWQDVETARANIAALAKQPVRFFRFPFLREGDTRAKLEAGRAYLQKSGQRNVPVTIDNQDWSFEEPWLTDKSDALREDYHASLRLAVEHHEARGDKLLGRTSPQVLLLHAGAVGASEWDRLFTWLEKTGHRFAAADEVLADPVFAQPHEFIGTNGCGLFDRLLDKRDRERAIAKAKELLTTQAAAWNAGDVDAFCSVYAEDAVFMSPSGVTNGRAAVRDRYKKKYPTKQAMGTLTLEVIDARVAKGIEVTPLGDAVPSRVHGVTVGAKWTLAYPDKPAASGMTLLTMVPTGEGFEIVQDASF